MAGQDRQRQAFGDGQALIYSGVTNTAQKEGWRLVLSVPLEVYVTCGTSIGAGITAVGHIAPVVDWKSQCGGSVRKVTRCAYWHLSSKNRFQSRIRGRKARKFGRKDWEIERGFWEEDGRLSGTLGGFVAAIGSQTGCPLALQK
ncbi:hypothetical protein JOM56_002616 [Amanita muscaria]